MDGSHMKPETQLTQKVLLKRDDFASNQEVRWCPGCGDYAILASVQRTLPLLNIPKEQVVFVSGIGCSSRFPYYLDTFGFHTIHGRAPAIATGIKTANPDLTVFVVTGDGDGLSIGSNHLLHLMRRNLNVTVLLFNNRIYGLTKGQYSPTSEAGKKTKSSPKGSVEPGLNPIQFALGANCSFIARAIDVDAKGLQDILIEAVKHQGTSFIEIYQNCNVFNDGAFSDISDKQARQEKTLFLKPGNPMVTEGQGTALSLQEGVFKKAKSEEAPFIHQKDLPTSLLWQLSEMAQPDFPVLTGILRQVSRDVFDQTLHERKTANSTHLGELFNRGAVWQVD